MKFWLDVLTNQKKSIGECENSRAVKQSVNIEIGYQQAAENR